MADSDRDLLNRVDNRTIETLQIVKEARAEVAELRGHWMALEHRVKKLEQHTIPAPPLGPMRAPLASEKDLTRLARKAVREAREAARDEVEEITGRHQIEELKGELRKRDGSRLRVVNLGLHIIAGVLIAVLTYLLLGRGPSH